MTETAPDEDTWKDLEFGWKTVKYVKSNAIVVAKDGMTLGVGAGQMNRLEAAKIALRQAGERAEGAILASDAFFPFDDVVRLAAEYKIKAIIQPGALSGIRIPSLLPTRPGYPWYSPGAGTSGIEDMFNDMLTLVRQETQVSGRIVTTEEKKICGSITGQ